MQTIKIKIYGKVQGVFFRDSAIKKAHKLGIKAEPRNEPDNTVLIQAKGHKDKLKKFISWCNKGPKLAQVEKVKILKN